MMVSARLGCVLYLLSYWDLVHGGCQASLLAFPCESEVTKVTVALLRPSPDCC